MNPWIRPSTFQCFTPLTCIESLAGYLLLWRKWSWSRNVREFVEIVPLWGNEHRSLGRSRISQCGNSVWRFNICPSRIGRFGRSPFFGPTIEFEKFITRIEAQKSKVVSRVCWAIATLVLPIEDGQSHSNCTEAAMKLFWIVNNQDIRVPCRNSLI